MWTDVHASEVATAADPQGRFAGAGGNVADRSEHSNPCVPFNDVAIGITGAAGMTRRIGRSGTGAAGYGDDDRRWPKPGNVGSNDYATKRGTGMG